MNFNMKEYEMKHFTWQHYPQLLNISYQIHLCASYLNEYHWQNSNQVMLEEVFDWFAGIVSPALCPISLWNISLVFKNMIDLRQNTLKRVQEKQYMKKKKNLWCGCLWISHDLKPTEYIGGKCDLRLWLQHGCSNQAVWVEQSHAQLSLKITILNIGKRPYHLFS